MSLKKYSIFIIIILIIIAVFLIKNNYKKLKIGNNISNKSVDEIEEYILNMESYEAVANITIKSNKNINTYVVKQKYLKNGNIYKQEILEPQNLHGIEFIYDGTALKIENTKLALKKLYENYNYVGSNELSLTAFIEDYKQDNNARITKNNGIIILETQSKNKNRYNTSKKLYIENGKIKKLEINDKAQNTRIYILYKEIVINEIKKDEILAFSVKTIDVDV